MTEQEGSPVEPGSGQGSDQAAGASYEGTALADAAAAVRAWLDGRLPGEWSAQPPEVVVDRDEVSVVLALPEAWGDGAEGARRFREQTREQRVELARGLERQWNRKVAWGVVAGGERHLFTSLSVPTMTRLRQSERVVLDVLVDAGVARSRSEALAWCVRLVGRNTAEWLADLRGALRDVERLRAAGPQPTEPPAA